MIGIQRPTLLFIETAADQDIDQHNRGIVRFGQECINAMRFYE